MPSLFCFSLTGFVMRDFLVFPVTGIISSSKLVECASSVVSVPVGSDLRDRLVCRVGTAVGGLDNFSCLVERPERPRRVGAVLVVVFSVSGSSSVVLSLITSSPASVTAFPVILLVTATVSLSSERSRITASLAVVVTLSRGNDSMSRSIASFSLINASVCSVKPEGSTSDREAEFSETDEFNGSSASFSSAEDSLITSLEPNTEEEKEINLFRGRNTNLPASNR